MLYQKYIINVKYLHIYVYNEHEKNITICHYLN
nr:ALPV-283 [Albatrosspox virus]